MPLLILSGCLMALALGVAAHMKDALHPGVLLAGLWAIVAAAYGGLPHSFRAINVETVLLVSASVLAFVVGSLAANSSAPPDRGPQMRATWVRDGIFWLAVLGLPAFVWRAQEIAASAEFTDSFLINVRIALTAELDDAQSYGPLGYLVTISFASTLVELAASKRRLFEPRGWIAFGAALSYSVLATGRTYLFLLLIALAFVALVQRRIGPATLAWSGLAMLSVVFFGLGIVFNKIGEDSPFIGALSAMDSLSLYLLGSLAALDLSLQSFNMPLEWGLNAFRSLMAVLKAAGADVVVVPLVQEFVLVPEPTNVYTVLRPYIQDFGLAGAPAFLALFGWMHGHLYRAAKSRDPRLVILYALSMYPLLMQFFQDQYLSLLTTWVLFALLVFACFRRQPAAA